MGAQSDRSTDEGIKTANKFFQQSAGIFDHIHQLMSSPRGKALFSSTQGTFILNQYCGQISDLVLISGVICVNLPCLSMESLNFVKQLLLSQAQLCFYEKAVRDKKTNGTMKSSVIAKLAAQSSTLFRNAVAACKVGSMASILDPTWSYHVEYQVMNVIR